MKIPNAAVKLLNDLENRLDPSVEDDLISQWKSFLSGGFKGEIFMPYRKTLSVPDELPEININDAICDFDLMLVSQLSIASNALNSRIFMPNIRSNYGTGILSSLFGAEIFMMPRHTDTLPTTRTVGGTEKIREIFSHGVPNLDNGFGRSVFEMGEYFAEVLSRYPKISHCVHVYHPDVQGPLDIAELLWGGDIFYAMYDEPELVESVLKIITETYTRFLDRWFELFPPDDTYNFHWGYMFKGKIFIRDDSAMNLSPEFYERFAKPFDAALLKYFGGGAIHFCGRGDHYIETMSKIPLLYGINMSQPHLNDMEKIYRATLDREIPLLSFDPRRAEQDKKRGFHGLMNVM